VCDRYQRQQVPVSLWAVIEDRKLVYQRRLVGKNHVKREIEQALDLYQPDWRGKMDTSQWEEEYRFALNNVSTSRLYSTVSHMFDKKERNRRGQMLSMQLLDYCRSYEQLPPEDQTTVQALLSGKKEDMMDIWLQTQDDALRLYESLGLEVEKDKMYEVRASIEITPIDNSLPCTDKSHKEAA
jgi:hypothetical protein